MKKYSWLVMSNLVCLLFLTGCMYKTEEQQAPAAVYEEQIESVQRAVAAFQEETGGLLPIKTRDADVDPYIKYPIEFSKLVPSKMEKIPSNAYENGGVYQYVLVDVEENPTVKLVDIRSAEKLRDLNLRKTINSGVIPFKEPVGEGVYEVDYEKMGFKKPLSVPSPYSESHLPILVGGDGHFYVDYSLDLQKVVNELEKLPTPGEDIRPLLIERYAVLPAYSLPYTVDKQGEVVFSKK